MNFSEFSTRLHLDVARSYIDGANHLYGLFPDRLGDVAPANFLLAHGAELTLKAAASRLGAGIEELEKFGHNLASVYQCLSEKRPALKHEVEKVVQRKWREYLRTARADHIRPIAEYGITKSGLLLEMGIPDNQAIGDFCPKFVTDLNWLSARHHHGGGIFRYLELGLEQVPMIKSFGLDEPTVPKSITWGCHYILEWLAKVPAATP